MSEKILSYEEIIECISESKPVPNMINIPDIIQPENKISDPQLPERKKPWERVAQLKQQGEAHDKKDTE